MRQQFIYQLDEEKMRRELRARTMAASDDAYRRFCEYADAHTRQVSKRALPAVHLKIDRKYLVPAAAALVLIVLSVLFLNFGGTADKRETAASTSEPFVPMPQTEPEIIIPQPDNHELPAPAETKPQQAMQSAKPEIVREKPEADPEKKNDEQPPKTEVATSAPAQPSAQATTTQADTKKSRRNAADILEPVQLPDIRPTFITPEQEEDIRIN